MKIKTRYLIIAAAAILAISAAATAWQFTGAREGRTATVFVDGEAVKTVDLENGDGTYPIETKYGVNVVRVRDGGVCVEDADCRDKLCVKMGLQTNGLTPIACLPHHLVIRIDDAAPNDSVDAVAGIAP